jgi:O-antigen ligase
MGDPISTRFGLLLKSVNVSTELPVNFIGTITVFAILICLYFFFQEFRLCRRVAIIACMIPSLIATILTQSRGTFIALLIATFILLLIKAKKIIPLFLLAMTGFVMFAPLQSKISISSFYSNSVISRMKINYFTYEVIKDYPITGIGFGMQAFINNIDKNAYMKKIPEEYRPGPDEVYTPHNLLLDITVRLGLIGLILFLYIIFVFGRLCWKTIRYARDEVIREWGRLTVVSFIAYFIIGMAEPLILFRASARVFYIILAMVTILWRLNHEERDIYGQPDTAN